MGRPRTPLPPGQADEALGYAERALDRKAAYFSVGLKETRRSLGALRRRGLTLRQGDFAVEANAWLERHLNADGRQALRTALRQARMQSQREAPLRSVRLPTKVHADLAKLAEELGLSLPATVARLVADASPG